MSANLSETRPHEISLSRRQLPSCWPQALRRGDGIRICLLFIVIAVGIIAAIIRRGIATRKPWTWWLALTAIVFVARFVITTYYPEIRDHVIFPL
ncbi:MAG: hypothetical protein U0805_14305 [Pirellulales bacterium]